MELKVRRFEDTDNIEVFDGNECVARSRGCMLFIFDTTALETAIQIAERYGKAFGIVFYNDYDAWFPATEASADWAC